MSSTVHYKLVELLPRLLGISIIFKRGILRLRSKLGIPRHIIPTAVRDWGKGHGEERREGERLHTSVERNG